MRIPPPFELTGAPQERDYTSPDFKLSSLTTITLVHDYLCPWCWIGFLHARRLQEEFGVTFDWRGAELVPPSMNYTPAPRKEPDPNEPPKPKGRFDLFVESEGYVMPEPRPAFVSTHNALLAAEWVWLEAQDGFERYNEAVYRAYWEQRRDIADVEVLAGIADSVGLSGAALADSVRDGRYENHVVPFDDTAYSIGIRHVPTFLFNAEELLAEAPYTDLARATERFLIRVERIRQRQQGG